MRMFQPTRLADSTAGETLAAKRRKEFLDALKKKEKEELLANERTRELRRLRLAKSGGSK